MGYGAEKNAWTLYRPFIEDVLPIVADPNLPLRGALRKIGKVPSVITSDGYAVGLRGWPTRVTSPSDIESWSSDQRYGIGIRCGGQHSVYAIDIDDDVLGDYVREFVLRIMGNVAVRFRRGSVRSLIAFRIPGLVQGKQVVRTQYGAVELLGRGQQFVAEGTHESGTRYEWTQRLSDVVSEDLLRTVWSGIISRFAMATASTSARSIIADSAVSANATLAALHAHNLVISTVHTSGRVDIDCPWKDEHSMDSGPSQTSFFLPFFGGQTDEAFVCLHAHCTSRNISHLKKFLGINPPPMEFAIVSDDPEDKTSKFRIFHFSEGLDGEDPPWLIHTLIPDACVGVLYGASQNGKSFLALDLLCHLAQGSSWRNFTVSRGKGLYICAEGEGGFRRRRRAYIENSGVSPKDLDVFYLLQAPDLCNAEDLQALYRVVWAVGGVKLIIIDTLSASIAGRNENDTAVISLLIANCKNLANKLNATIILIHHPGKDASHGPRGSSVLFDNVDFVLSVVKNKSAPEERMVLVHKQKDGELLTKDLRFKLKPVKIGTDPLGMPITSCVVEHLGLFTPTSKDNP